MGPTLLHLQMYTGSLTCLQIWVCAVNMKGGQAQENSIGPREDHSFLYLSFALQFLRNTSIPPVFFYHCTQEARLKQYFEDFECFLLSWSALLLTIGVGTVFGACIPLILGHM